MGIMCFSDGEPPRYGALEEGSSCTVVFKGDPLLNEIEPDGRIVKLEEVCLLSPVISRSKVIGTGTNFGEEVHVLGSSEPETMPPTFMKTSISVIGPDDPIVLPKWNQDVTYEDEFAVVIKFLAKDVLLDEVDQVILGYTLYNDVTARDAMDGDPRLRGKSFDTACPLGPWVVVNPELDVQNLVTSGSIGDAHTAGSTVHMLHTVRESIAYCSTLFTLPPGDVITTGCPGVSRPIETGDIVSFETPGTGRFTNPVTCR